MSKHKSEVMVTVDAPRDIEKAIGIKKGDMDTTFLEIDLKDYDVLRPDEHTFINTLLQLSNQIIQLRQQYQQHVAAIKDITQTIKDLKAGKIREIYTQKGGMFLIKQRVEKSLIGDLIKRKQEIINANNLTVGQLQKNYDVFSEYGKKSAMRLAKFLDGDADKNEILKLEKEIDEEAKNILKGEI